MSGWSASQRLFFIAHVHSGAYWGNLGGLHLDFSFSLVVFLIRSVKSSLLLSSGVNSKSLSAPLCQSIIFRATQHHHGSFAAKSIVAASTNHFCGTLFKEVLVPGNCSPVKHNKL
jgi:hypothetical protein